MLAGPAGAVEPSGSAADPFARQAAPATARPTNAATSPSNDSAGVAQIKPIETPYVPYHATATSPWQPRAVEALPAADGGAIPAQAGATPGSVFESIFDPSKLVPVVFPDPPAAPPATTGDAPSRNNILPRDDGPVRDDAAAPAVELRPSRNDLSTSAPIDAGKMTPVTFGPAKVEKPANPTKKKAAAKPLRDDHDDRDDIDARHGEADLPASLKSDAAKSAGRRPDVASPDAVKPAGVKPPVTAKYHLPEPPIPLP
jgi:hypothetical protein